MMFHLAFGGRPGLRCFFQEKKEKILLEVFPAQLWHVLPLAVDSVPAIIGITDDRFIAFTSNIFAILGLRALYFLLAGVVDMFCYLHYGLAAILGFVGLKMIAEYGFKEFGESLIASSRNLPEDEQKVDGQ